MAGQDGTKWKPGERAVALFSHYSKFENCFVARSIFMQRINRRNPRITLRFIRATALMYIDLTPEYAVIYSRKDARAAKTKHDAISCK